MAGHHHQGEQVPRNSWMMDHMDNPANKPTQGNDIRHQQHQQPPVRQQPEQPQQFRQPEQPQVPYQQPEEPVLSRQEERAKARNQARTMNPVKNSTKLETDDDIWDKVNLTRFVIISSTLDRLFTVAGKPA